MRAWPLLLCLLLVAVPVRAEDEPAAPKDLHAQVAAWLEDLRSEEFEVREEARRHLLAQGLQAREVLEAARDDPDPEVRRTVRAVLSRAPSRPQVDPSKVRPGDFSKLGVLSLRAEERPLHEVLDDLGRVMHARIEPPADLRDARLTIALTDVPCYDAVDAIARAMKLRPARPIDRTGVLELLAADERVKPAPRAAAGPMELTVTEVSATRVFGVEAVPRYALKLQLAWAPFVQVRQYERPHVEVARDPDGKAYKPSASMARSASYGVSTSMKHHATTIHIEPAEMGCKPILAALEVRVPIHLQYDLASVELSDLSRTDVCLGADGKPAEPGAPESVRFHSVTEAEGMRGQWVVDFSATLLEEDAQRSLQAHLVEEDGTLRQVNVYGGRSIGADGTMRITARAWRGNRGKPKSLRVRWFRRVEQGTLRFRLEDIPLR